MRKSKPTLNSSNPPRIWNNCKENIPKINGEPLTSKEHYSNLMDLIKSHKPLEVFKERETNKVT